MQFELLHPADQIILMMERIYTYGMTTTSGGNISIVDDQGDLWITPSAIDKGALTRSDIVCVTSSGEVIGNHKPSSELPFHQSIYRARPDLKAVIHAHPPALVTFSIVRAAPDTRLLPNERQICGEIGMAAYALPGSEELGRNIAEVFAKGINTVMLENHGVVVGGADLFTAFQVFETLDFCARLEIQAKRVGQPLLLDEESLNTVRLAQQKPKLPSFTPEGFPTPEREARREMCRFIRRAYDQRLFTSTQGTFSQRLEGNSFLITPYGMDRKYVEPGHLVRVENGAIEAGKTPSRSVLLHQAIYEQHPHIHSVIIAHPPSIMAFAVTESTFDSRTIPESYILLRGTPKLPFRSVYEKEQETASRFVKDTPIAIVENNCIVTTGKSLLEAFDRLEVAEYSAAALIDAKSLGSIVTIDAAKIRDLEQAFGL
ncbi:class II aldolase/adducin family protein [Paenibacillus turpanensis]|uniref:class II aldolase/adducin family protein n=1 Tax=Paenibacillus turpanensis TaxID=2689078 RepID=UPI00140D96BD|nr:class II aldolase/adducin family protein [Paenibacillus turpanensis]